MSNRNRNSSSDDSPPGFERVEGQGNRNNSNYRSRNNSNDRNRNNSNYRSRNSTSDDTPPGLERVEGQESHDIPGHEENFPDDDGEMESFLQPMWSAPELLDHTAETSGMPMEGVVLAWRGNNTGKSRPGVPFPLEHLTYQKKSLGRRKDDLRTERDIKAWGIVAWRVDKKSVSQDPISLLKPMTGAWYPETYVYIHWWSGDASWESRHNLRYVCASNHLKTDMLIYNVAKEQEADYREALTGVRPEYAPANTRMANDHWKNVNAYRGAHWFQPRAEENRRITSIGYEPVIKEEDNSQEFDGDTGLRQGSIAGSNSDGFEEAGEEEEGYYEGSSEGEERDNFESEEVVQDDGEQQHGHTQQRQRYLSPIDEEGSVLESRVFFTPEGTPSRARGRGEAQQIYGISTPRATRSPSSGHPFQGNRGQARRMLETPGNRRMPRFNQGNSGLSNYSNRGNEQRTPQPSQDNRSNQGDQQRQAPHSSRSNRLNQDNQWQTPRSTQGNRSIQDNQRQTPQSSRSNRSNQDNQRETPQSSRSNRLNQDNQWQTPHSTQGNRSIQDNQRQTPQSSRSNRSNQDNQRETPQSSRSNRLNQDNQWQTPHSTQGNRSIQDNQRQTPQSTQGNRSIQGNQRQTPQSSRSNRSNQDNQRETPQSSQGNRSNQDDQRQTPQSSRSNRPSQDNQRQTPQSIQGNRSIQGHQRQTPQSSRSNRSNQDNQRQRTPQSSQGNRSNQGNEGDQRSAGLNIPPSEGNQSQPQQRRGRGRPRRGDLSNPLSNIPTRRSTRHTRVPGGP
ncbi:hypothetical protein N7497_011317 [Penicillium chrysogenum]|nr:hypothetical protein N7497_011317 [Penicillium chrysogenum]